MKKIRLGVLGVSGHFLRRLVLPLRSSERVAISGIASRERSKAQACAEKYGIPAVFDDYAALLSSPEIDAVYIPLPNHLHLDWIKRAADAGKHILCEKPLTLNAGQALEAVDYAAKKKVKLMEAFMYKFHPQWQHVRELLLSGEIGAVHSIHTFFFYANLDPKNIRNIKETGGGALYDIGCYAISIPRFLLGKEPIRVLGQFGFDPVFQTDVLDSGWLDFGAERSSFIVGTKTAPYQRVIIHGAGGFIEVGVPVNTFPDVEAEVIVSTGVGQRTVKFPIVNQYRLLFEAFAAALETDRLPVAPRDAVDNMKVIDALFMSNKTGAWVSV